MVSIRTLSATVAILAVSGGIAAAQSPVTNLNMRSGPGTGYQILRVIPAGAPVAVLGCDGRWCQVNYAGRIGYANGSYLSGESRAIVVAPGAVGAYASAGGYGAYASADGYGYGYGRRPFGYGYRGGYAGYGGGYGAYASEYGPGLTIGIGSSFNPAWRGGHN